MPTLDFYGTKSQMTFNNGGYTRAVTYNETVVTDWVDCPINTSHGVVMSVYFTGTDVDLADDGTVDQAFMSGYKYADEAINQNVSGYNWSDYWLVFLNKIEVR